MPLISVIVPVYNSGYTLNRCVDSILNQTFHDWELLLIDDGSIDQSGKICDQYGETDQRIKVFHKKNGGVCSARNYGIDHAKGTWIAFCDSDDYVDENWLNLYVENLSQGISFIVQFFKIPGKDKYNLSHNVIFYNDIYVGLYEMYNQKILGYVWNKLLNSYIIKSNYIRFNEKFRFREDEDFVLRYLQHSDCFTIIYDGAYYYDMPDLSTKYLTMDNFYTSLSMYSSIKELIKNFNDKIRLRYLMELTNAFFATFDNDSIPKKECITRINLYTQNVKCLSLIREVSLITKCLLHFPSFILYYILKLKSSIHRSLERMKF
jgi:glycosyltransferase involved in cell wall biosynthesis